jgi:hypothetical protein
MRAALYLLLLQDVCIRSARRHICTTLRLGDETAVSLPLLLAITTGTETSCYKWLARIVAAIVGHTGQTSRKRSLVTRLCRPRA